MKIGVISDTHITDKTTALPQKVLEAFRGLDMIIHAGDLTDLRVLEELKSICPNVKAVWGNMDKEETRKKLPEKEIIKVGQYKIGLMHGRGHPVNLVNMLDEAFKDSGVKLIIFGHSHSAINKKIGDILYFNPGSPTDTVFAPYKSYGIIEINDKIKASIIKI